MSSRRKQCTHEAMIGAATLRCRWGVSLATALSLVATIALALELPLKAQYVVFPKLTLNLEFSICQGLYSVGAGAEVQVGISIRVFTQAASKGIAQRLAAQLCCRGNVEQVPAQRTPQVLIMCDFA